MLKSKRRRKPAITKGKDCPSALKMRAVFSSDTSVNFRQDAGRDITEDRTLCSIRFVPNPLPQLLPSPLLQMQQYFNTFLVERNRTIGLFSWCAASPKHKSALCFRLDAGQRKRGRSRHKGRSIDPARPCSSSQSSSSLSSPNETCYSFVRRALQVCIPLFNCSLFKDAFSIYRLVMVT